MKKCKTYVGFVCEVPKIGIGVCFYIKKGEEFTIFKTTEIVEVKELTLKGQFHFKTRGGDTYYAQLTTKKA